MQHTDITSLSIDPLDRIEGVSIREARSDLRYFPQWTGAPWLGTYIDLFGYKRKDFSDQIKEIGEEGRGQGSEGQRPETGDQGKAISERISEKR
jgi:hypothetical protein